MRSPGELVLDKGGLETTVLYKGVADDFDVCTHEDGSFDIFCVSEKGALLHISFSDGSTYVATVIESRTPDGSISCVRAFCINGRFHLLYCLNRPEKLLVHHIVQRGSYGITPQVVEVIGDRCIYDAVADDSGDIRILVQTREKSLVLRSFVYSQKSYLPPRKIAECEVRSLSVAADGNGFFASYVSSENGTHSVVLCDVTGQTETVVSKGVSARSAVALVPSEDGLRVQWTENSMCFAASPDKGRMHAVNFGKTAGMARLRVSGGKNLADRGAVKCSGSFFDEAHLVEWENRKNTFVPVGHDVDELKRKYIETLSRKNDFEDFERGLARIEESLEKLTALVRASLQNDDSAGNNKEE